jgi:histidinol-phosphate aminotransferase
VIGPLALARADLRDFVPYEAAVSGADAIRLHANESSWRHDWDDSDAGLNRYPDPRPGVLAERLAGLYGVDASQVLLTRGSDDAIDVLVRVFCEAGRDTVSTCPPTFGMYAVSARLQGAGVVEVPLVADDGFALDVDALCAAAEGAKIVFLCSPNNPTGNTVGAGVLADLCERLADKALVVVDEAYAEFSQSPSAVRLRSRFDNLVVLRTLSKAYALAGARLGVLIADPAVVRLLRAVLPPYPLPSLCLEAAGRLLSPSALERARREVEATVARRDRLAGQLRELDEVIRVWPSEGNFLLLEMRDAAACIAACGDRGVLVRDFSGKPGLAGCVRITIGDERQNGLVLDALRELRS